MGTNEFAEISRKNGSLCRVDVGLGPNGIIENVAKA